MNLSGKGSSTYKTFLTFPDATGLQGVGSGAFKQMSDGGGNNSALYLGIDCAKVAGTLTSQNVIPSVTNTYTLGDSTHIYYEGWFNLLNVAGAATITGGVGIILTINSTNSDGSNIEFTNSGTVNGYIGSAKGLLNSPYNILSDFAILSQNNLLFGVNNAGITTTALKLDITGAATFASSVTATNYYATAMPTSRPSTVGEFYQDTAANILANGDKVIGIRV